MQFINFEPEISFEVFKNEKKDIVLKNSKIIKDDLYETLFQSAVSIFWTKDFSKVN